MAERYEKPELIEFPILDEDMVQSWGGRPGFPGKPGKPPCKKHCMSGGTAVGGHCQTGGTAGWKCQSGTLARRDKCQSGGHAGKMCRAGAIPCHS